MRFRIFKARNKGCLYGKTKEEKIELFNSLSKFATFDKPFFEQQYWDLLPHERKEFGDWVINDLNQKKQMKLMLNVIEQMLENKIAKK